MPLSLEETKENIRAANDIVDVIGSYITIKRAGSAFKALCPFHKEKTPSFVINQQRQSFHCFGCGAGGDVFKFVMQHEGVDFMTAMRMLAERAGINIELDRRGPKGSSDIDSLLNIHAGLTELYQQILIEEDAGGAALEYLRKREIDRATIDKFKIGFAPNYDLTMKWGRQKGFSREQLMKSGVLIDKGTAGFDRFKGRIMFPICDSLGRTIGFSGRILESDQSPAKYLNSPETPIFKKSRVLYGLHLARKQIIDRKRALVCEGQLDCIRCHIHGFDNAIAPQGTALTSEQARIIKRHADQVVLLFDSDVAGRKASLRSSEILLEAGLAVGIARLPDGTDPDSLLRSQGAGALEPIISDFKSAVGYLVEYHAQVEDFNSSAGILRTSQAVIELISKSPSAVMQDQMKREAAALLGVSESALSRDLVSKATTDAPKPKPARTKRKDYPPEEFQALSCLCQHPELAPFARENLDETMFTSPPCGKIFRLIAHDGVLTETGLARYIDQEDEETLKLAARLDVQPLPATDTDFDAQQALRYIIMKMWRRYLEHQRAGLKAKSSSTESERHRQSRLTYAMVALNECMRGDDWLRAISTIKDVSSSDLT